MIIIKIIILYFIQIRHTDDFPSTGTRLVRLICNAVETDMEISIFYNTFIYYNVNFFTDVLF